MSKLYFIKNPEVFQGEKYLKTNKSYFEGWYFKNVSDENGISFIPGINVDKDNKKAFIQVITNTSSYYINYSIDVFKFSENPFYIKIKNNIFSKEGIHIDIKDNSKNIKIYGNIKYSNNKNIKISNINPNIMGPFSYIPFMECNHAILSMKNRVEGELFINNKIMKFESGTGYIEKDWGTSFPKAYIWCQGNNFKNKEVSFMMSIANIPFKVFEFTGLICDILINDKEFKFTTYNNAKIIKYSIEDNLLSIILKQKDYYLEVRSIFDKGLKLTAPVKGKMQKDIFETILANIAVTLRLKNEIIFSDTSSNCGLEIVKFDK